MLDARKAMSSLPALLLGCILAAAAAACMLIDIRKQTFREKYRSTCVGKNLAI